MIKKIMSDTWAKAFFTLSIVCLLGSMTKGFMSIIKNAASYTPPAKSKVQNANNAANAINQHAQNMNNVANQAFNGGSATNSSPVQHINNIINKQQPKVDLKPRVVGAGAVNFIQPKNKSFWVVDPEGLDPNADSKQIDEVIFNAKDGDIVKLKPGIYDLDIAFSNSPPKYIKFEGLGEKKDIKINVETGWDFKIKDKKMSFLNLTLSFNEKSIKMINAQVDATNVILEGVAKYSGFFRIEGNSTLNLRNVHAHGAGRGTVLNIQHGKAIIEKSSFSGFSKVLDVSKRSSFEIRDSKITHSDRGIYIYKTLGKGIIENTEFSDNLNYGVYSSAPRFSLSIKNSKFIRNNIGLKLNGGGQTDVYDSTISQNFDDGIHVYDSKLTVHSAKIQSNQNYGIYKNNRSQIKYGDIKYYNNGRGNTNRIRTNLRYPASF